MPTSLIKAVSCKSTQVIIRNMGRKIQNITLAFKKNREQKKDTKIVPKIQLVYDDSRSVSKGFMVTQCSTIDKSSGCGLRQIRAQILALPDPAEKLGVCPGFMCLQYTASSQLVIGTAFAFALRPFSRTSVPGTLSNQPYFHGYLPPPNFHCTNSQR